MGRIIAAYDPALTIAPTKLPALGAEPWWSDFDGIGSDSAAVKATLDCAVAGAVNLDSIIRAKAAGGKGDLITFETVADGVNDGLAGRVQISLSGTALKAHFTPGVTTVAQFEATLAGYPWTDILVELDTAGTPGNVLTAADVFAPTALSGGSSNLGHQGGGKHSVGATVYFTPSNWDALGQVEIVFQRCSTQDGTGRWGYIEPSAMIGGTVQHIILIGSGGEAFIQAAMLPAGTSLAIPLRMPGVPRFRFGLRAGDAGALAAFACTAALDLIQDEIIA